MLSDPKLRKILIIVLVVPLLLEVFVFNFRFWESLFWKDISGYTVSIDDGIVIIDNINADVHNVYFEFEESREIVPLRMLVSDGANTDFSYNVTEVDNSIAESRYIRIHPDGKVRTIKVILNPYSEDPSYAVPGKVKVALNVTRPFMFRFVRFLIALFITVVIAIFRPGSKIYRTRLTGEDKKLGYKNRIAVIVTASVICCSWLVTILQFEDVPIMEYYKRDHVEAIYSIQASALLSGQTALSVEPPDYLAEMENPYDPYQRSIKAEETGISARGDFAYYNGRYYSYYGIVPTLMFYLPYMAITGEALPNLLPILVFSIIFFIAVFRITYLLSRKFDGLSLGHYLLITTGVVYASFAVYCVQTPWIYSVAFTGGLSMAASALAFWIDGAGVIESSARPDKSAKAIIRLILGSVFMCLAIGCRPSFGLCFLLAFPIFWKAIRAKNFFSVKGLINTFAVVLPALILGSMLLYYNYIRFDSFFDFGASRNLSIDVMYHEASVETIPLGIWEYLFQMPSVKGTFPYFHSVYDWNNYSTDYQGVLFFDPVFGGVFMLAPFAVFALFAIARRRRLKENGLFGFCLLSFAISLVLMIIDIQMGGISMRYQIDFAFFISLVSAIVLFDHLSEAGIEPGNKYDKLVHYLIIAFTALTIILLFMTSMALEKPDPMATHSRDLYYSLKYLFFVLR